MTKRTQRTIPKLLLIIKASSEREAQNAALDRNVHVTDIASLECNTYHARCDVNSIVKIQKWFNEPGQTIPGFGYPSGTLLYFNTRS